MNIVTSKKKIVDKLVQECSENIDDSEMIFNITLNDYENTCGSCTIYTVLFAIASSIIIGISSTFTYFHWYLKKIVLEQWFIKHVNDNSRKRII